MLDVTEGLARGGDRLADLDDWRSSAVERDHDLGAARD